jgi:hypothetical protein
MSKEYKPYTSFGLLNATLRKTYQISSTELFRQGVISHRDLHTINSTSRDAEILKRVARLHPEELFSLLKDLSHFITSQEENEPGTEMYQRVFDCVEEEYQNAIFTDIGNTCEWIPNQK